jgi:hypothetical protein
MLQQRLQTQAEATAQRFDALAAEIERMGLHEAWLIKPLIDGKVYQSRWKPLTSLLYMHTYTSHCCCDDVSHTLCVLQQV